MDRPALLKSIAEAGYNIGFGAKKHFATYDIVEKMPGWIGFASIAVGILSLVFEALSAKLPAAALAVAGVAGLYISLYDHKKMDYERAGGELTQLFNGLRDLYRNVQGGADLGQGLAKLQRLEAASYGVAISKQIVFSDWYAHYKFFAQMQIDWINEQKHFRWGDKVPLSLRVWFGLLALIGVGGGAYWAWTSVFH